MEEEEEEEGLEEEEGDLGAGEEGEGSEAGVDTEEGVGALGVDSKIQMELLLENRRSGRGADGFGRKFCDKGGLLTEEQVLKYEKCKSL